MNKRIFVFVLAIVSLLILRACLEEGATQNTVVEEPLPVIGEQPEITLFSGFPEPAANSVFEVTDQFISNLEAPIPPQCYTKTEGQYNPCYVCHQLYPRGADSAYRMNKLDDGGLQGAYLFSDVGISNHWQNLFEDRTDWVAAISDEDILRYINTENYSSLANTLTENDWQGFIPDLKDYHLGNAAFSELGIAKDGSAWVAFNYKPFPSTFWPTNGSTDDVLIRLPEKFRTLQGEYSELTYILNLSLVEMAIKDLEEIDIPIASETIFNRDLNGDGVISGETSILERQEKFLGDADTITMLQQQYPAGTEFMHSVRYVGISAEQDIVVPARMKELRYMKKIRELSDQELENRYWRERKEKFDQQLPSFINHADNGFENGLAWLVQGFIESENGELRPQTFEERMFCMGCHSSIGATVDQTFAFGRKVTGVKGWSYINLKGMKDSPSQASDVPEILEYIQKVHGGNEFRENEEMKQRWFNLDGSIKEQAIRQADVYSLITPSASRALQLNKAYTHIVRHQDFIYGRDATIKPVVNVYKEIDESSPPLEPQYQVYGWDQRLRW